MQRALIIDHFLIRRRTEQETVGHPIIVMLVTAARDFVIYQPLLFSKAANEHQNSLLLPDEL